MLLDAVILTLIISLFAGGRLGRLPDLELRAVWVFVLAAVVRVALDIIGLKQWSLALTFGPWLSVSSYLLLLLAFLVNRHLWPLRLVALGVLLNFLVVAANGGSMPVDRDLARRSAPPKLVQLLDDPHYLVHKPITEQTRLVFLTDVLPLPMLYPRPKFYSPGSVGDIIITVGACALLVIGLGAFGIKRRAPTPAELPPS